VRVVTMLLVAGSIFATGSALGGEPAGMKPVERLRLALFLDGTSYQVGQPIVYVAALENVSGAAVEDVPMMDTFANGFALIVEREGEREPLSRVGLFRNRVFTGPGMSIAPGGGLTASGNLLLQYGTRRDGHVNPLRAETYVLPPGRYSVECRVLASTGMRPGAGIGWVRSDKATFRIQETGRWEYSAVHADSIMMGMADRRAGRREDCAAALRDQVNSSAYWYLLECAQGAMNRESLSQILSAVDEEEGGPVRRAAILDRALAGGTLNDASEIKGIAAVLNAPSRRLERSVANAWEARYTQGFVPTRRIRR